MYKYYYKSTDGITIQYLGKSKKVPATCVQITKAQYDNYKAIANSVEDREGYITIFTLYIDGTYSVEYLKEEIPDEVEE